MRIKSHRHVFVCCALAAMMCLAIWIIRSPPSSLPNVTITVLGTQTISNLLVISVVASNGSDLILKYAGNPPYSTVTRGVGAQRVHLAVAQSSWHAYGGCLLPGQTLAYELTARPALRQFVVGTKFEVGGPKLTLYGLMRRAGLLAQHEKACGRILAWVPYGMPRHIEPHSPEIVILTTAKDGWPPGQDTIRTPATVARH